MACRTKFDQGIFEHKMWQIIARNSARHMSAQKSSRLFLFLDLPEAGAWLIELELEYLKVTSLPNLLFSLSVLGGHPGTWTSSSLGLWPGTYPRRVGQVMGLGPGPGPGPGTLPGLDLLDLDLDLDRTRTRSCSRCFCLASLLSCWISVCSVLSLFTGGTLLGGLIAIITACSAMQGLNIRNALFSFLVRWAMGDSR